MVMAHDLAVALGKSVVFADRDSEIGLERIFYLKPTREKIHSLINLPMIKGGMKFQADFEKLKEFALKDRLLFDDPILHTVMIVERGFVPFFFFSSCSSLS